MTLNNVLLAFILTTIAGLATIIGGFISTHKRTQRPGNLSVMLGFAAGAMICVSFLDLIPVSIKSLSAISDLPTAITTAFISLFVGSAAVYIIDRLVPQSVSLKNVSIEEANHAIPETEKNANKKVRLFRSGMMIAIIMTIHNFPEGIATFTGTLHNVSLGLSLAIAIAIHNIPEGVSIASPIYASTGSKLMALKYVIFSAIAEPIGAAFAYILFISAMPESMFGIIFATTAGMMLYVSINELVPSAKLHSTRIRQPLIGMAAGAFVMAISLVLVNAK